MPLKDQATWVRALGTLLLGCLLVGYLPGFVELGEDTLHLIAEGHTLHTADHDGEDEQPSHGCDDCSHCVSCHGQGTPFVAALPAWAPAAQAAETANERPGVDDAALEGVRVRVDRPPQA